MVEPHHLQSRVFAGIGALPTLSKPGMWRAWVLICLVSLLAALTTLRSSPVAWQDEVQILDYGRTFLPGADQRYGLSLDAAGQALRPITYLGCIASEACYQIAGADMAGPRLLMVVGAIAAASVMLGYLLARDTKPWIALLLASAFLWDPLFAQGYRGARCDSWVMAFMIGACWVARSEAPCRTRPLFRDAACGLLIALAAMTWVSAILLLPLVALEIGLAAVRRGGSLIWSCIAAEARVALWAVLGIVALLSPFMNQVGAMVDATLFHSSLVLGADFKPTSIAAGLLDPFSVSPLLPVAGAAALIFRRQWLLGLACASALAIVCKSGPYGHRNVYLEPYFAVSLAAIDVRPAVDTSTRWLAWMSRGLIVLLVVWAGGMTLVGRNAIALREQASRDPDRPREELLAACGTGKRVVYLSAWRAYYAVRSFDWRFLRPFDFTPENIRTCLSKCDTAVLSRDQQWEHLQPELLTELGFREIELGSRSGDALFRVYSRARGSGDLPSSSLRNESH